MPAPSAFHTLTRPRMLLLHAAGILAVVAALLLGRWQVHAWQENRQDKAAEAARLPAVPLADLIGPDDAYPRDGVGRPVEIVGQWLPDDTFFLADRLHDGDLGVWQVTPLAVCTEPSACTDASAIPVVVGWAPARDAAVPAPTGTVDLTGWLQPAEPEAATDPDPSDDVLYGLRTADVLQRMDRDLYSAYVILDAPASARGALEPVTPASLPKAPTFTSLRNLLYGLEWWFFGGFAVFLWARWCRDELAAVRRGEATGEETGEGTGDVTSVSEDADVDREGEPARIPSES